jgi:hypothetical protein
MVQRDLSDTCRLTHDRDREYIAETALRSYDVLARPSSAQLAPQSNDANVNAPIAYIFPSPGRSNQMLPTEDTLRRIKKCLQQSAVHLAQRNSCRMALGEALRQMIIRPSCKHIAERLRLPRLTPSRSLVAEYDPDAREELSQTYWLGNVVISASVECRHALLLVRGTDNNGQRWIERVSNQAHRTLNFDSLLREPGIELPVGRGCATHGGSSKVYRSR